MKTIKIIFLALTLSLSLFSCNKKDDDSNIKIEEPVDPCKNVVCMNGGFCINGSCDCPDGYSGPSCSSLITPSLIRINLIEVESYPQTDNGAGWDLTSGPDIYVEVSKGSNVVFTSGQYQNASGPKSFTSNIEINSPLEEYIIRIYDYDDVDSDDYMDGFSFIPYNSSQGFVNPIILENPSFTNMKIKLYTEYSW